MQPGLSHPLPVRSRPQRRLLCEITTLVLAAVTAVPFLFAGKKGYCAQPAHVPNIVLVLADDLGYGDPHCYNAESKIPTPNIDRLAREGLRFTDAHAPSSVCSPSRYGILTGRYAWRTRLKRWVLWAWGAPLIEPERLTVAQMLREHGYRTACIGKWHLGFDWPTRDGRPASSATQGANVDFHRPLGGGPLAHGFDEYFGVDVPNFPPYVFIEGDRTVGLPTLKKPKTMFGTPGPMLPGWNLEAVLPTLTDRAVGFVDRQAKESPGRPFFLYFALTSPHTPLEPTKEFRGRSGAGKYGDYVAQTDDCLGQVLKALERNGQADNTLVIFTSDNGSWDRDGNYIYNQSVTKDFGHRPNGSLRGIKADAWEGGQRVPLVLRWPGQVKPAAVCDETVSLVDFMATVAAILDHKLPDTAAEDSINVLPLLLGVKPEHPLRETTILHSGDGTFIVREGAWKLILGSGSGGFPEFYRPPVKTAGQLYRLDSDPAEKTNLYSEYPDVVKRLTQHLEAIKASGQRAIAARSPGG